MKKLLSIILTLSISLLPISVWADSKVSALSNNSSPALTDLLYDEASSTSYNITVQQLSNIVDANINWALVSNLAPTSAVNWGTGVGYAAGSVWTATSNPNGNWQTIAGILGYTPQTNLSLISGTYSNGDWCSYASSGTLLNCNNAVPQVNLGLIAGTLTNGDVCTYTSSGTLLSCNTAGTISGVSLGSNLATLTAANSTLTLSGSYTGATARTIGLNLGNANTWTALQQHTNGDFGILGSSTGYTLLESGLSSTGNNTLTLPTESSDTLVDLTGTQTLTNKTLTSPTLTTPALGTPSSGVATNLTGTASSLSIGGNAATSTTAPTTALLATGTVTGATSQAQIFTAPTTGRASINLAASSAVNPSSPNSGDLWWNGTNLYFYNGATNKDLLSGGGGGAVSSVSNSDGTLVVSPTTGSVIVSNGALNNNKAFENIMNNNGGQE